MDVAGKSESGVMPAAPLTWTPKSWEGLTADQIAPLGQMGRMAAGGLSICPIATDGSKKSVGRWQEWQKNIAPPLLVMRWANKGHGYAVVGGVVSGGLEVLDFDDGELYPPWYQQCHSVIEHYDLPIVATPSRGYHIYWRCTEISGNVKLAKSENGSTLIETRGEGGYVAGPGNPRSVHKTGRLYLQMGGVELPAVPTITPDDRKHLLCAAASFDRFGLRQEAINKQAKRLKSEQWQQNHSHQDSGFRVGDDYKAKATWPDVLEPHGWTRAGGTFWTRPDGDPGAHSASVNEARGGASVLTVFSSNAGALAPVSSDKATWDLFSAYTALNHDGNRVEAARELRRKGYGG